MDPFGTPAPGPDPDRGLEWGVVYAADNGRTRILGYRDECTARAVARTSAAVTRRVRTAVVARPVARGPWTEQPDAH